MTEIRDATWDDFDAVVALGGQEVQAAHVRQRWNLPGYDVGWVAVDDGRVVGHAALDGTQDASVAAQNPDAGDGLMARVVERARERGFGHIAITAAADDEQLTELVRRNSFTLDREILRMWRVLDGDLPELNWPAGLTVRTYAPEDGEQVQALLDTEYMEWDRDHVPRTHDSWLAVMTAHDDFDPALWFLVERDATLVACALHWKESKERGWVKDIAVRGSERGHGLGKALLHHAFRAYADRGVKQVGLKVDSTNPTGALQLYERVGFVTDQTLGIWVKRL
jgi:GNAT superfamily N-acetyltransferase